MTFTVVRAVRGVEATGPEHHDKLRRLADTVPPSIPAAVMDIPYAGEVFRLDLSEFAQTIPGALE